MRSLPALLAVAIAVILVVGVVGTFVVQPQKMISVTAEFTEAPGLYPGNHVDVLGIPIGTVTSVQPGPDHVDVTMSVRADVALPRNVDAELMAPEIVSDRFVSLNPPYTGGPRMVDHHVIPPSRTATPVSADQVLNTLDQLVTALGPTGANRSGALSSLLAQLAKTFGGQGPNLHSAITNLGQALGALGQNGPQLAGLLNHLGTFTGALSTDGNAYTSFANDLAAVSTELASDDADIAGALHNLQLALGQLAAFVQTNRSALGGTAANLQTFAATLANEQQALVQTLATAPLALQNVVNAINPSAPGGTALRVRYDPSPATAAINGPICGNTLLRLLVVTTGQAHPTPLDLVCGFTAAVGALGTAPGAPTGPDLSLGALMNAGRS
jgi:phospholipid/cholesterol/gamma-HCH transport system substrate-binding protein